MRYAAESADDFAALANWPAPVVAGDGASVVAGAGAGAPVVTGVGAGASVVTGVGAGASVGAVVGASVVAVVPPPQPAHTMATTEQIAAKQKRMMPQLLSVLHKLASSNQ